MIISEKQLVLLIKYLEIALKDNLSGFGKESAKKLLAAIINQQSDELKTVGI